MSTGKESRERARSGKDLAERDGPSFGLIASAAVLALIVIAGLVGFFGSRGGGDDRTDAASTPARPTETAVAPPPAAVGVSGFGTPDVDLFMRRVDVPNNPAGQPLVQDASQQRKPTDRDWLTAAPNGTKDPGGWQRVFGSSVPFSTSDGPARIEDGLAVGYAHTPQGAALAAAQITYRLNARPADRTLYTRQITATAAQVAAYDKAVAEKKLPAQQPEKVTRYMVAPDAFQIESYADDMAIVRIAGRGPVTDGQSTWLAMRLIMVWQDGDWKLRPVAEGAQRNEIVTSLVGWTQW